MILLLSINQAGLLEMFMDDLKEALCLTLPRLTLHDKGKAEELYWKEW